jgi:hypothetical protein
VGRFAEAEGRDGRAVLRRRPDGLDRCLGAIEVFGGVDWVEQEVKEVFKVSFGRRRRLNDKTHRPSFLRLASSLDWSPFNTV